MKFLQRMFDSIAFRPLTTMWVAAMFVVFFIGSGQFGMLVGFLFLSTVSLILLVATMQREVNMVRRKVEEHDREIAEIIKKEMEQET